VGLYDKPSAGDSTSLVFSAKYHSDIIDMLTAYQQTGPGFGPGGRLRETAVLSIKNTEITEVPRGGVLGIDGVVFDADDDENTFAGLPLTLKGAKPTKAIHAGRIGIALAPIEQDKIRKCVVMGWVQAKVDIKNANDRLADIVDDDVTKLVSGSSGIPMIPCQSGLGEKWAIVLLGGSASTSLEWAMVVGDIPAFSAVDGTAITATPGKSVSQSVNIMAWNGANLEADQDATTLLGINASGTTIRSSTAEPVLVLGFRDTVDGDKSFVIVNVMDFRGMPNYDKAAMQIPFHDVANGDFLLDAEACP